MENVGRLYSLSLAVKQRRFPFALFECQVQQLPIPPRGGPSGGSESQAAEDSGANSGLSFSLAAPLPKDSPDIP